MTTYHVILLGLSEGTYPMDIEGLLAKRDDVTYIADWQLKEDDPDVVGETLSYILADPEDEV